ncbi:hypothetical protein J6590_031974 [Homalodisca vitripennis]|nr:hypothetical protein J6590_031974 [Homalodisca vitripennis]
MKLIQPEYHVGDPGSTPTKTPLCRRTETSDIERNRPVLARVRTQGPSQDIIVRRITSNKPEGVFWTYAGFGNLAKRNSKIQKMHCKNSTRKERSVVPNPNQAQQPSLSDILSGGIILSNSHPTFEFLCKPGVAHCATLAKTNGSGALLTSHQFAVMSAVLATITRISWERRG